MSDFSDLDALLQKYVNDGLPGCGCMIAKQGEVLYENYFGWADMENQVKLERNHVFRQASLTKVAMYTVAMMLYEQGKFLMSDPLYDYFPEWRHSTKMICKPEGSVDIVPTEHPITIKNILNMTCGLPYDMIMGDTPVQHPVSRLMANAMKPLREKGHFTLREQIKAISTVPLVYEPGTRFLYGFASELTAGLLETICGKPAETVMREMLFEPLGMDSSANYTFGDLSERLVKNYYLHKDKHLGDSDALYALTPQQDSLFVGPLGSISGFSRLITNCSDFTKVMQMLACGGTYQGKRIMGRKTIDLKRTNTLPDSVIKEDFANDYLAGYGYGYGVRTLMDPYSGHHNGSVGSFGWTGGSGTWAEADPEDGVSIVYMHNIQPNLEQYHHLRMRAVAYGCIK